MSVIRNVALALMLSGAPLAASAATPSDQLVIGLSLNNVLTLDPAGIAGRESTNIVSNVYDTLVDLDPVERGALTPNLAESWTIEGDMIRFTLREGLQFASGNPVTAEDVVWSIRRNIRLGLIGAGKWAVFGFDADNIDRLLVAEGNGVSLTLAEPGDPNLILMMMAEPDVAAIIDRQTVEANATGDDLGAQWLRTNAAGSGPFTLQTFRSNEILLLARNENYWGEAPAMRRVVYRHIPESQSKRLQIERGDIDVAIGLVGADVSAFENSEDVTIQTTPSSGFYFLAMSMKDERFAQAGVREAVISSIDYEGINGSLLQYYGVKRLRPVAPGVPGALEDPDLSRSADEGRALLAEAGYADGFSTRILALNEPPFSDIATALQANLAAIGIRAEVVQGTGDTVYGPMRARAFEMVVGRGGGGQEPHPHSNLRALVINPNNSDDAQLSGIIGWRTSFVDEELNEMSQAALEERDPERQAQMYGEIQERYEDLVPALQPIAAVLDTVLVRNNVQGYQNHFAWTVHLKDVRKE